MVDLRIAMPSFPHVLRKLHTDQDNNKLSMFQAKLCAARYVATKCFLGWKLYFAIFNPRWPAWAASPIGIWVWCTTWIYTCSGCSHRFCDYSKIYCLCEKKQQCCKCTNLWLRCYWSVYSCLVIWFIIMSSYMCKHSSGSTKNVFIQCVCSLSIWSIQIEDAVQPADISMKNLLYSMLSAEGSYKSRKVCSHIRNIFDFTYKVCSQNKLPYLWEVTVLPT